MHEGDDGGESGSEGEEVKRWIRVRARARRGYAEASTGEMTTWLRLRVPILKPELYLHIEGQRHDRLEITMMM